MKVPKIIVIFLVSLVLIPSISLAQANPSVPTRDELVLKLIASLMEQVKALQAQLAIMQKNSSQATSSIITATTTANVGKDKGKPYLAVDGNWYYPNAYDANGKKLQAPTPVSKKTVSMSSEDENSYSLGVAPKTPSTEYSAVPVLTFEVLGKNDSFDLRKLTAHFDIDGTAKITNAYLYQGDKTPVASAVVTKNIASFDIPEGTTGASFGPSIPTEYTVKVAIAGLEETTLNNLPKCPGRYYGTGNLSSIEPGYTWVSSAPKLGTVTIPASFESKIESGDIYVYDSADNLIPVTGAIEGFVQISKYKTLNNLCWAPGYYEA